MVADYFVVFGAENLPACCLFSLHFVYTDWMLPAFVADYLKMFLQVSCSQLVFLQVDYMQVDSC